MNGHLPHDHKRRYAEFHDEDDKTIPPPMLSTVSLLYGDEAQKTDSRSVTGIYNLDFPTNSQVEFQQQMRSKLASQLGDSNGSSHLTEMESHSHHQNDYSMSNILSHSIHSQSNHVDSNNNNNNKSINFDTASSGYNLHSTSYSGLLASGRTQTTATTSHDNSFTSVSSENGVKNSSRTQPTADPGSLHVHTIKRARRRIIRNSLGSPQRLSRIELALLQQQLQLEQQNQQREISVENVYSYNLLPSNEKETASFPSTTQNHANDEQSSLNMPGSIPSTYEGSNYQDSDPGKSLFWMSLEKNKSNPSLISISEEKHVELRKRIEERKRMDELKELFKKENNVEMIVEQENKSGSSRGSSGGNGLASQDRVPLGIIPTSLLNQENDVFKKPKSKIPIPTSMNLVGFSAKSPGQPNYRTTSQYATSGEMPPLISPRGAVSNSLNNPSSGLNKIARDHGIALLVSESPQFRMSNHPENPAASMEVKVAPLAQLSQLSQPQHSQHEHITTSRKKTLSINGVNYDKLQLIGRGGTSKVYKVLAPNNRHYAIKKVIFDQFDDSSVKGFKGEIDLLKKLKNSERVVKLIDHEVRDGAIFLVMECGDLDLATVFQNRLKRLDLEFVKYHAIEILKCVLAVHENGIVHSDLKPANFLFVKGMLKIIDFGIANAVPEHTSNIYRDSQIGTPNYMAPEALIETNLTGHQVAKTTWRVGRPSDVWSCGCIIYQMIYGRPPYGAYTGNQRIMAIMNPQVKIQFNSRGIGDAKVPQTAIKLMKKCLARDPLERWTVEQCLNSDFLHPKVVTESFVRDLVHLSINFGHSSRANGGVISADVYDQVVETVLKQIEELNY